MKNYFVYIITNSTNHVLYIGITNNLQRRIDEHKTGIISGFSKRYRLKKLVYYEEFSDVKLALYREKQLKNWHRAWKKNLITSINPNWDDLSLF